MDKTLAARLSRIRSAAGSPPKRPQPSLPSTHPSFSDAFGSEWMESAPFVLFRAVASAIAFSPEAVDPRFSILCPGSSRAFENEAPLDPERLLFFDLETTGLSSGAGTIAFLAAFARYERKDTQGYALKIRQYLLLDYPGECDFLDRLLSEFSRGGEEPVLVSYNGRAFDAQILRTRCLMNAVRPPDPPHLDLVYPARRLWRRSLENCSLSTIERDALGLDRGDDLPGSEAPDAWFDFVKRGDPVRLLRICEHNARDLEGLASLLIRVSKIASDPLKAVSVPSRAPVDGESLALRWYAAAKNARGGDSETELRGLSRSLLERAAAEGSYRAAFVLAFECAAEGNPARAAALRSFVARAEGAASFSLPSPGLRAAACRRLSLDALRRLRDETLALRWANEGLSLPDLPEGARRDLERLASRIGSRS